MNRKWVLQNLTEALEELTRTVRELQEDPEYDIGDFLPAMSHLYHHVNVAWNARDASESQLRELSDSDFKQWSAFPTDMYLFE